MKSLKIAIINEKYNAGATRCARDLEQQLALCHQVRYYPRNTGETTDSVLQDLITFTPDIVHLHSYYGDFPYSFLAKISYRYPTCFTPHDPRPIGTLHPSSIVCWDCPRSNWCFRCAIVPRWRKVLLLNPYFWLRLKKRYWHWRTANNLRIVSPSQWLQQRLRQTEFRRFAIQHIPYGIDQKHFSPIPDARLQLALPANRKIILYVSYTGTEWIANPRKGLHYLADAFVQRLLPQYPEALLLVVGEGLVPNHPNVQPAGLVAQQHLPLYYSAADVFVAPTLADNLPYTVLEAMGCAVPVVASRVGGVHEEIIDGETGTLVPPGDPSALGAAILAILNDPIKARNMGLAGRKHIVTVFAMEHFIHAHEKLYFEMAQTQPPREGIRSCSGI